MNKFNDYTERTVDNNLKKYKMFIQFKQYDIMIKIGIITESQKQEFLKKINKKTGFIAIITEERSVLFNAEDMLYCLFNEVNDT